jgi:hypothetical protein
MLVLACNGASAITLTASFGLIADTALSPAKVSPVTFRKIHGRKEFDLQSIIPPPGIVL